MELDSHKRQKISDGYGPEFFRVYSIVIPADFEVSLKAMQELQRNINHFSPQILATFEKVTGDPHKLQKGDEFQIRITGPWNGPVRVKDVNPHSFSFVTLEGHMEAGEIHFAIKKVNDQQTAFEIKSRARSRDAVVDLVYDKIPIAKLAQTEMWTSFCKNFSEKALILSHVEEEKIKESIAEVEILTQRYDEETGQWQKI